MRARPFLTISLLLAINGAVICGAESGEEADKPVVHVTFWFDTEDYLLLAADDAAKRLAEIFTARNVRATFKIVGEKARVLRARGRGDVIEALRKHDVGYHTDYHSIHPTPSEYSRDLGWDEGVAEFARREGQGLADLRDIFGPKTACYGQPGSSWTPQSYGALRQWGIPLYLDDTWQVGLDGRPFWYCGVLNALNLQGYTTRASLGDAAEVRAGCERFEAIRQRVVREGGGLISIYYHPCEWVHEKFWDGVNFARGANPPRAQWQRPPQKPADVTDRWFRHFETYLDYVIARPNVRLVTASEIVDLYPDRAYERPFGRGDIAALARSMAREVSFARLDGRTVSAAEILSILAQTVVEYDKTGKIPESARCGFLYGPSDAPERVVEEGEFQWPRFVEACRDFLDAAKTVHRIPTVVWIAGEPVDPVDFAATLGRAASSLLEDGKPPETLPLAEGDWTVAKYVPEDQARHWGWVIFPEDFRAPQMMALARRQSWTLKPAVLATARR